MSSTPSSDPTLLYRQRDGILAVELLTAAIAHLDVFGVLARRPLSLDELCRELGTHERPTDVLMTLLAAQGLVERSGGRFAPSAVAREFLAGDAPWNMRPYYTSARERPFCRSMLEVLRTGRPANWTNQDDAWEQKMADEDFARAFTAEMDCRGAYLGPLMARALDLGGVSHILDVGGGSGVYACAIAEAYPHVRATVLEKPPVDAIAARSIAARGMSERVAVLACDMFADPLPRHADAHLYSNVLHDWGDGQVAALLRRSHEALPSGGLVVIHDCHVNRDKTGPLHVAEYSALLMHFTEGKCYSVGEIEDHLAAAGFVEPRFAEVAVARSVITARRP